MSGGGVEHTLLLELVNQQREVAQTMGETTSAIKSLEKTLKEHMEREEAELKEIRGKLQKHEALINQAKGARIMLVGIAAFVSGVVSFFFGKH